MGSQLGPPPASDKATAGRMNAEGIPVFYGALEEETCVSDQGSCPCGKLRDPCEVRPGAFKPIRVLDLNASLSIVYRASLHRLLQLRLLFLADLLEDQSRRTSLAEGGGPSANGIPDPNYIEKRSRERFLEGLVAGFRNEQACHAT